MYMFTLSKLNSARVGVHLPSVQANDARMRKPRMRSAAKRNRLVGTGAARRERRVRRVQLVGAGKEHVAVAVAAAAGAHRTGRRTGRVHRSACNTKTDGFE